MPRPDFINNDDIKRWMKMLEADNQVPKELINTPLVKEVCLAGLWLTEELEKLNCPDVIMFRIQWTAGKLSYGRDPWDIHQEILSQYKNNTLIFELDETEPNELN